MNRPTNPKKTRKTMIALGVPPKYLRSEAEIADMFPVWASRARLRHRVPVKPELPGRELAAAWIDDEPPFAFANRYPARPVKWWTPPGHS